MEKYPGLFLKENTKKLAWEQCHKILCLTSLLNPGGTQLVPTQLHTKGLAFWEAWELGARLAGNYSRVSAVCPLVGKSSHSSPHSPPSCGVPGWQFPKGLWDRPQGAATETCRVVFLNGKYTNEQCVFQEMLFWLYYSGGSHSRSFKWLGISQWVGPMIPGCHTKKPVIRFLRWKHIAPPLGMFPKELTLSL